MAAYWCCCCCCWLAIIWLESWCEGDDEEGEEAGGGLGTGGRGVSLIIGEELLLWGDLVRVACMGVMKLDCCCCCCCWCG